jgi:hypothetical protein
MVIIMIHICLHIQIANINVWSKDLDLPIAYLPDMNAGITVNLALMPQFHVAGFTVIFTCAKCFIYATYTAAAV